MCGGVRSVRVWVCAGDEDLSAAVQNVTAGLKTTKATASLPDTVSVYVCVCHCVSYLVTV